MAIPPRSIEETLTRLNEIMPNMAKRMRQCGEYVRIHHDKIMFSTVAELAKNAGVQPSAMIRFCHQLGFNGYSEMQKMFRQEATQSSPDYSTRITKLREKGDLTPANLLAEFVEAGRHSLAELAHNINEDKLDKAVETLSGANLIHIVGYRRAHPVAACLSYTFEKLNIPSICHDNLGKLSKFSTLRQSDVVIAVTFTPYTAGTIEFISQALEKDIEVIVISDSETSPANLKGTIFLKAMDADVGNFRALSASMNLAIALAVSVGAYQSG